MSSRLMETYTNGNIVERIEVSDFELKQVQDLLAKEPVMVIWDKLEDLRKKEDKEIEDQLNDMGSRHNTALRQAEQKVNSLQADLNRADSELQAVARAGRYSEAPALEGKKLEIKQAIHAAQLELDRVNLAVQSEASQFHENLAAGDDSTKGPKLNGVNYKVFGNILRALTWDWLYRRMGVEPARRYELVRQDLRWKVIGARQSVATSESALEEFRKSAQARYSGTNVSVEAAKNTLQPKPVTMPSLENRPVSAPPPMGRDGIPQWGSVGSR